MQDQVLEAIECGVSLLGICKIVFEIIFLLRAIKLVKDIREWEAFTSSFMHCLESPLQTETLVDNELGAAEASFVGHQSPLPPHPVQP